MAQQCLSPLQKIIRGFFALKELKKLLALFKLSNHYCYGISKKGAFFQELKASLAWVENSDRLLDREYSYLEEDCMKTDQAHLWKSCLVLNFE